MSRLPPLLKIFNTVATIVIFAAVGFLSCAFYLGSEEEYAQLQQQVVGNFCLRFSCFVLFGIALSFLPVLINAIVCWRTSLPMNNAYRFARNAAIVSIASALGGTAVFFSH